MAKYIDSAGLDALLAGISEAISKKSYNPTTFTPIPSTAIQALFATPAQALSAAPAPTKPIGVDLMYVDADCIGFTSSSSNIDIDFGDGFVGRNTDEIASHVYSKVGNYTVTVRCEIDSLTNGKERLHTVDVLPTCKTFISPNNPEPAKMFEGCTSLVNLDADIFEGTY